MRGGLKMLGVFEVKEDWLESGDNWGNECLIEKER